MNPTGSQHEEASPANPRVPSPGGWISFLARLSVAALVFEAVSGLAITFSPFHAAMQWNVIVHTIV
ncbi:MAG TPA: hypothetical protein VL793_11010, partial [Patescibacteria group bacterium]|nr:hypothetical protein [Patescibacteria group bacterium]